MDNIIKISQSGNANVKLEVSGEDPLTITTELINRATTECTTQIVEARKEKYHTTEEDKGICTVCDATQWHSTRNG